MDFDAVVLAGGTGSRLGGIDKSRLRVAGRPLLDRVLAACRSARTIVVVGDPRPTRRPVQWTMETPRHGGPLAGLGAGLDALDAESTRVAVLSCDLPFLTDADVARLIGATATAEAAVLDDGDRVQPLVAAYRTERLRAALDSVGDLRDRPVRAVLDHVGPIARIPAHGAARDCDTPGDLIAARAETRRTETRRTEGAR